MCPEHPVHSRGCEELMAGLVERRAGGTGGKGGGWNGFLGHVTPLFSPRPRPPPTFVSPLLPVTPILSASMYLSPRKTCFPGSHAHCSRQPPSRPGPAPRWRPGRGEPRPRSASAILQRHLEVSRGNALPLGLAPRTNPAPQGGTHPRSCRILQRLLHGDRASHKQPPPGTRPASSPPARALELPPAATVTTTRALGVN